LNRKQARIQEAAMATVTTPKSSMDDAALYRLVSWLSPGFPVGAYAYSHGLEFAIESGYVTDEETLRQWIESILIHGTGRSDAILFCAAWNVVYRNDVKQLEDVLGLANAHRGTSEMALESSAQGDAFLRTVQACWSSPAFERWAFILKKPNQVASYSTAVAVASAVAGIPLRAALLVFLQAFSANLISAGVRLVPLGQTAGQRIQVGLQEIIISSVDLGLARTLDDLGVSAPLIDWTSAQHETQYTRLFRS
jgi:urease accessory protein